MAEFMKLASDAPGTKFKPMFLKRDGAILYRLVDGKWKWDASAVTYLTGNYVIETLKSDPASLE